MMVDFFILRVKEKIMTNKSPLQSIRIKCLDCSSTSNGVQQCKNSGCPLYPLRFGKNVPRGTSKVKAIRHYCVKHCANNQPTEVRHCPSADCQLYPFRLGKNPNRSKKSQLETETATEQPLEFKIGGAERGFLR